MQIANEGLEKPKNERLKSQIQALRSGHRASIFDALSAIRADGGIEILPELFELLIDQEDVEITRTIASLLNDLKDEEAVPILAEAVVNPEYESVAEVIVSACWQNGLSYGKYAANFVKTAISGSYQTTLEAFTVLEEAVGELDDAERARLIKIIKHALVEKDDQKKILLHELVKVLEQY